MQMRDILRRNHLLFIDFSDINILLLSLISSLFDTLVYYMKNLSL